MASPKRTLHKNASLARSSKGMCSLGWMDTGHTFNQMWIALSSGERGISHCQPKISLASSPPAANPCEAVAADVVPEYNPDKPEAMAESIDRKISLMRSMSVDPALDKSRSVQERQQYMPEAPASRPSFGAGGDARRTSGQVEWLPYSSTKEKLESWIQPDTNDSSSNRNLLRQLTKDEKY